MRKTYIFILASLISSMIYASGEKLAALEGFLNETYYGSATAEEALTLTDNVKSIKNQLQSHLTTCPLKTDLAVDDTTAEPSEFLNAVSCDNLIATAKEAELPQIQVKAIVFDLGAEETIDETRQEALLASLQEAYGPEDSQAAAERDQLINHLKTCKHDFGIIDTAQSFVGWDDEFGCKGIIETAKEGKIDYLEVKGALEVALSTPEASVERASREAPERPRRKVSKP